MTGGQEDLVRRELQARKALRVLELQDQKVVLVCLGLRAPRVCLETKEAEARLVRIMHIFLYNMMIL